VTDNGKLTEVLDLTGLMTPSLAAEGLFGALRAARDHGTMTTVMDGGKAIAIIGTRHMSPGLARWAVPEQGQAVPPYFGADVHYHGRAIHEHAGGTELHGHSPDKPV
jgi:hypothetical protein